MWRMPARVELGHEGTGRGDSDDVVAGGGERGELRPEQQGQGHVRRRDVDE